uniref:carbohydrate ABC transporter permease n=1 Tax=Halocatena halophila TaxID=2814576 RepID=UPI0038B27613
MSQKTTPEQRTETNRVEDVAQRMIQRPQSVYRILFYVATGFFLLVALFPIYWLTILALTPSEQITNLGLFPNGFNPGAFIRVFELVPFHLYMLNSVLLATMATVIVLLVGSLAGYAFGRFDFPGRAGILLGVLVISYFPSVTFFIPLFQLFTGNVSLLGVSSPELFNTAGAVTLPLSALTLPLAIYFLATFYRQIPDGLEDAARVEGSTRIGALFKVIMPLSAPGVATIAVVTFIITYNEFFFSYLMVEGMANHWAPIVHGLFRFQSTRHVFYNLIAAASIVGVIPMAILVAIAQNKIVSGLTSGALKE